MAVEPLAMCYPGLVEGRLTPRFRTIRVSDGTKEIEVPRKLLIANQP